ncbi:2-amino-4-hydroxy-6-hydroxymethyldihydropteridine diphosphokinase [Sinomicrobium weinanense]|uniref:2-amino-4-hydroxy-6-hydroxymethyldihydropteridine pyrophosphokinase n=1 Tax=Sinomicrobium weinanense TaxID=2842200 RepID=A0A926JPD6_9FLAO|nr:2-amino-4-hydroxy-6-hydroxymethyldihydropteridine diphosphokinase [Sinomicrobium weinanense]MBC9795013.1 2-amino-4-hydroxy-6-hydroxymethyldihydropteridine diphosphokinase [Sinomicrobium weinanense]MBU3125126.1 2-amino-4-hydroxy-6-hydroxymethyldihydropteridine diphosphokinase [Sinomicrobium weinanense]
MKRAYLSIGSNLGNKIQNLQNAISRLEKDNRLKVVSCSKVYQTPAWGFTGDDFLNACIATETTFEPLDLLYHILETEKSLGRVRTEEKGYQPRTVDIDILFYEDEIIKSDELMVPHPRIPNRRFVLQPLSDIAPGKVHPELQKTVTQLLEECADNSDISVTGHKLQTQRENPFSSLNYIAIEGNIGSGKTTLATKIAEDFNGKLILERFADNPFLPKFYKDQSRYAFSLEMSFLADRYQQFTDDTSQPDLFKNFMVSDYDIFKSLIFAKVTLGEDEFRLYRKLFDIVYKEVIKPDIYIYLYQNTEKLLQNIKKRGRKYEQDIPYDYLEKINKGYFDFIKTHQYQNVFILDISDLDFVQNKNDYETIIDKIHGFKDEVQQL